jgi:hypothetical protein
MKAVHFFIMTLLTVCSCTKPGTIAIQHTAVKKTVLKSYSIFKWETELCSHEGKYDPEKYSEQQLQNTFDLWFTYNALQLNTRDYEIYVEDFKSFDAAAQLEKLEQEYSSKKHTYNKMILLPGAYWEDLRKSRLRELEEEFELKKITLKAHLNPSALLKNRFTKNCLRYAEALSSADTIAMFNEWIELEKEMGNTNPTQSEKFKKIINSPDRLIHARMTLMVYGWHNCANKQVYRDNSKVNYSELFSQAFESVNEECDEP